MAGDGHLLSTLVRVLAAVDDAALSALASPGLVRRAHKDLEKESITIEESAAAVKIRVGGDVVTMTESGPAGARCSCPASEKCRHVLVATLYLKRHLAEAAEDVQTATPSKSPSHPETGSGDDSRVPELASPGEELLGYSSDILAKWLGRTTLNDAHRFLDGNPNVEVDESTAVTIRFPAWSVECRYFPGAGLAGIVTTAPRKSRERFLVAAVLAYQRHHGVWAEGPAKQRSALPAAVGAPRTRDEVLQSALSLIEELVGVGIAHLSGTVRDRLETLGVSCVGVNLPRLSLALKALADEVALALTRDARADDVRLFAMLARTYALCSALVSAAGGANPALVGRHRGQYDETGALELSGLGAYAWRTQSGYHGLTVLFWDMKGRRWCSWSDSRPVARDPSFSPLARYEQGLPWSGAASARRMSRMHFNLSGARRNDEDRLSASEQTQAACLGDTDPIAIDFGDRLLGDWAALCRHLATVTSVGLEEHHPLERVIIARPAAWGVRVFLQAEQTLVWPLFDQNRQALLLAIPFDDITRSAIEALEQVNPDVESPWGIVGRITASETQPRLWPYALLWDQRPVEARIQNLNLDASAMARSERPALPVAPSNAEEEPGFVSAHLEAVFKQWGGLEDELQHLAESGAKGTLPCMQSRLSAIAGRLRDRGFEPLAQCFDRLPSSPSPGEFVLRMKYVCMLYRDLGIRGTLDSRF
jgi:SWIM zinc finger